MPITCGNFIDLANSGFYDGLHFHRVVRKKPTILPVATVARFLFEIKFDTSDM